MAPAPPRARVDLAVSDRGLRIPRALGADIDQLGSNAAPETEHAAQGQQRDLAIGDRLVGSIFLGVSRQCMDWHCAGRIVRRVAGRPLRPENDHEIRRARVSLDRPPLRAVRSMSGRPDSCGSYPRLIVMLPTVVDTLMRCGEELFRSTSTCCSPIVVSVVTA